MSRFEGVFIIHWRDQKMSGVNGTWASKRCIFIFTVTLHKCRGPWRIHIPRVWVYLRLVTCRCGYVIFCGRLAVHFHSGKRQLHLWLVASFIKKVIFRFFLRICLWLMHRLYVNVYYLGRSHRFIKRCTRHILISNRWTV
ncbi:hypothetical protein FKM82_000166 [Ascaphus truei]